jgi:hypothetical protein
VKRRELDAYVREKVKVGVRDEMVPAGSVEGVSGACHGRVSLGKCPFLRRVCGEAGAVCDLVRLVGELKGELKMDRNGAIDGLRRFGIAWDPELERSWKRVSGWSPEFQAAWVRQVVFLRTHDCIELERETPYGTETWSQFFEKTT